MWWSCVCVHVCVCVCVCVCTYYVCMYVCMWYVCVICVCMCGRMNLPLCSLSPSCGHDKHGSNIYLLGPTAAQTKPPVDNFGLPPALPGYSPAPPPGYAELPPPPAFTSGTPEPPPPLCNRQVCRFMCVHVCACVCICVCVCVCVCISVCVSHASACMSASVLGIRVRH